MKHYPAAFINAIADEGTKAEAIQFLQETWNELCEVKEQLRETQTALKQAQETQTHCQAASAGCS